MKRTPVAAVSHLTTSISRESIVITVLCILDLVTTAVLLVVGLAEEGNPLMAYCLRHSMATFCLVKLGTVSALIGLAEWYRKQNAEFVRRIMRAAIAAYVLLYFGLLFAINFA